MYKKTSEELLAFLRKSPSCFHAIAQIREALLTCGCTELHEEEKWELQKEFYERH